MQNIQSYALIVFVNLTYPKHALPEKYYDEEYMKHYKSTLTAGYKILGVKT